MIKTNVYFDDFINAFQGSQYEHSFSYEGKRALYDYLEQLSDDIGEDIELDIVALSCEYDEYPSIIECAIEHGYDVDIISKDNLDEETNKAKDWLEERTQVIIFENGVIIQSL